MLFLFKTRCLTSPAIKLLSFRMHCFILILLFCFSMPPIGCADTTKLDLEKSIPPPPVTPEIPKSSTDPLLQKDSRQPAKIFGKTLINPKMFVNRATVYMRAGKFNKALADLNQAIEIAPEESRVYHLRAKVQMKLGNADAAKADLEKAKGLVSAAASAKKASPRPGRANKDKDKDKTTSHELTKALNADPNNVALLTKRADAYIKEGRTNKGIEDLTKAISLEPENQKLYSLRAKAYRISGDAKATKADKKRAKKMKEKKPSDETSQTSWLDKIKGLFNRKK